MKRRATVAIASAILWTSMARAQSTPEARATAKELFQQARVAMESKDYATACPKFEESQRLDPGGGTLLNLAVCHELLGRTASAWTEFSEALRVAKSDSRRDREELASMHLAALEAKLSRLSVDVPMTSRVDGLEVRCDGVALGAAAWNAPLPIDPGDHVLEASAPGKLAWRTTVHVGDDADRATVTVPELADAPPAPGSIAPPIPAAEPPTEPRGSADEDRGRAMRLAGVIVGGAGVVTLAAGSIIGLLAIETQASARDQCIPGACSPRAETLAERAGTLADASTALVLIGAAATITGVVLYFVAPAKSSPAAPSGSPHLALTF